MTATAGSSATFPTSRQTSMSTIAGSPWLLRPIRPSDDPHVAAVIHDVMTEHGCGGAGFAIHDDEVSAMHRAYQAPRAGYFVVTRGDAVYGGAGYAQLEGTREQDRVCELRKMYFRPEARGLGLGHAMLALLLDEMRAADYRRCYLETTSWMEPAQRLYQASGFVEQPSAEGATGHHGCDRFFSRAL